MKKAVISALVIAGIGVTSSAFADTEQTMGSDSDNDSQPQEGNEQGRGQWMNQGQGRFGSGVKAPYGTMDGRQNPMGNTAQLVKFFRTDITDAERETLKSLRDEHQEAVKSLSESMKEGDITAEEFKAKMESLFTDYLAALLPYVLSDKQEEFKAAFKAGPAPMMMNKNQQGVGRQDKGKGMEQGMRQGKNPGMEQGMKAAVTAVKKVQLLPAKIGTSIDAKLTALSTDTEKLAWLNAVIGKVEALEAKVKSKKSKAVLTELKDLLNQKVDALEGNDATEDAINEILQ
ncbi:MAG: hypothetical protein QG650_329 [Patescibacteria group bacterium]|nr:hypothetical protein [Patescibacteria group bacterium]